ncbi:MAG: hypothetical protein IPK00_14725 [Deltaproteobacteria bacterium]|nr:hypothetical protein [Deltaproteobacteria bacterium]
MTNQPTDHSRSGRALDLRGSGAGRTVRAIVALLGLLAIASTAVPVAIAAEVVEVRVGRHPDFTRVVFELDRAAGYRIERSDPSSKNAELIVSLEAGSIPRRIQSSKSFIEQVVVEPSGGRSIARIRLAQGGLKLKEMILASPPRIVLDVISESAAKSGVTTAAAKSTAPSKAPTASRPSTSPSTAAGSATKSASATTSLAGTSASSPAKSPATTAAAPSKPGNVVPAPAPKTKVLASTGSSGSSPSPNTQAAGQSAAPASAPSQGTPSAGAPPEGASDAGELALAQNDAGSAPSEWSDGASGMPDAEGSTGASDAAGLPGADTPAAADAAARANERPMMVKSNEAEQGGDGGGLLNWALVGAGLAVVAFGGLVVARRRRATALGDDDAETVGDDGDEAATSPFFGARESDDAETEEDEEEEEQTQPASASNPFAGLSDSTASFGADKAREAARPTRGADRPADKHSADRLADKQEKKPSESLLFDDAEETKMEGMEVISRSQATELGGAMPMMGAGSDELTQMFREMQRRVAALESRIDELVDARDRLERQVAAQTEELRVQRAAIARTQRAVRNLARPDDGVDDEPTEPALREPN